MIPYSSSALKADFALSFICPAEEDTDRERQGEATERDKQTWTKTEKSQTPSKKQVIHSICLPLIAETQVLMMYKTH